ncbi:hypothetical protein M5K25_025088 [Dendrobium thyrsiflorum]|uniref:Uncharacterized protein n=1 Tax=Dendrobium thyrsiflorum TaxID=117978 RepID=A0ABD0U3P6_DENTH
MMRMYENKILTGCIRTIWHKSTIIDNWCELLRAHPSGSLDNRRTPTTPSIATNKGLRLHLPSGNLHPRMARFPPLKHNEWKSEEILKEYIVSCVAPCLSVLEKQKYDLNIRFWFDNEIVGNASWGSKT